jgi:hypothetical protein
LQRRPERELRVEVVGFGGVEDAPVGGGAAAAIARWRPSKQGREWSPAGMYASLACGRKK